MYLEAAEEVLRKAGKPLHIKEIVEIARSMGLFQTAGETPVASMGSVIYVEMCKNGDNSTFIKVGPAVFGLRKQMPASDRPTSRAPKLRAINSARIGGAGKHRVMSELLFRGYDVTTAEGSQIDVEASRGRHAFSVKVFTVSRHPSGLYITTIREKAIDANRKAGALYVFMLRGSRGETDDFVMLSPAAVDVLIKKGRISTNKAGHQVRITIDSANATVGGADVSFCKNNWDFERISGHSPA